MAAAPRLVSSLCTEESLQSPVFLSWADRLRPAWDLTRSGKPTLIHRKLWEWIFIAEALRERGVLVPGSRGLGFGVGQEPLTAVFAAYGCEIVATDMDHVMAGAAGWTESGEHARVLEDLDKHGLCNSPTFRRNVEFRVVDMNDIPVDLRGFDFTWSSCALEHLGSIIHGQEFLLNQLRCLRPGGVGVHTTEFNLSSDNETVDLDETVLFRARDIDWLVRQFRRNNHQIEVDLDPGSTPADRHVDVPPYSNTHLRTRIEGFATTSLGLIVETNPSVVGERFARHQGWEVYRALRRNSVRARCQAQRLNLEARGVASRAKAKLRARVRANNT